MSCAEPTGGRSTRICATPKGGSASGHKPGRTTSTVIDAARREESMRRRNAAENVGIDSDTEEAGGDADNVVNDGDCGSVIVD